MFKNNNNKSEKITWQITAKERNVTYSMFSLSMQSLEHMCTLKGITKWLLRYVIKIAAAIETRHADKNIVIPLTGA